MGTSENLFHDHFAVKFPVCFVVKPGNIKYYFGFPPRLRKKYGRKLIRVPVFREPLMIFKE